MTPLAPHDCTQHGHLWLEGDSVPDDPKALATMTLYTRHRGRNPGLVPVICYHCKTTAKLEGHSRFIAPPTKTPTLGPALVSAHEAQR